MTLFFRAKKEEVGMWQERERGRRRSGGHRQGTQGESRVGIGKNSKVVFPLSLSLNLNRKCVLPG